MPPVWKSQACGDIRDDVSKVEVFDVWSGVFNRAFLMWEYRGRAYSLVDQWAPLSRIMASGIAGPAAKRRMSRVAAPAPAAAPARPSRRRRA